MAGSRTSSGSEPWVGGCGRLLPPTPTGPRALNQLVLMHWFAIVEMPWEHPPSPFDFVLGWGRVGSVGSCFIKASAFIKAPRPQLGRTAPAPPI